MNAKRRRFSTPIAAAALAVAVGALVTGMLALMRLDGTGRSAFYLEVATLSYQAIVIVGLGAMVKRVLEEAREKSNRHERDSLMRAEWVRRLINASHSVELARTYMWATPSMQTWDAQMDKVIAAYVELRDIRHDVATLTASRGPVFANWRATQGSVQGMEKYLVGLIDEYRTNRRRIAELEAGAEPSPGATATIWEGLEQLEELGGFLRGEGYAPFRKDYRAALETMRIPPAQHRIAA
jgi:hypothetical protein